MNIFRFGFDRKQIRARDEIKLAHHSEIKLAQERLTKADKDYGFLDLVQKTNIAGLIAACALQGRVLEAAISDKLNHATGSIFDSFHNVVAQNPNLYSSDFAVALATAGASLYLGHNKSTGVVGNRHEEIHAIRQEIEAMRNSPDLRSDQNEDLELLPSFAT